MTRLPSTGAKVPRLYEAAGYGAAVWSLGFAAASVWRIAAGPDERFAAYAYGLAMMGVLALLIKLIGAAIALAAVAPEAIRLPKQLVASALWAAFGLLSLYSLGNLVIAIGTVGGMLEPSAAWKAAGGVTSKSLLYALFCVAGATMFGALAIGFHRRNRLPRSPVIAGLVGAPMLLALVLAIAPAILESLGLLP